MFDIIGRNRSFGANMKTKFKILPLIVTLALVGCNKQSAEESISDAQTKLGLNQTAGAIIDLKNAIQVDSQNAEARFLLGKTYVSRGAAAAAEKELSQALKLGYDQEEVLPLLASALNLQYKNQEIVDLVNNAKNLSPAVETSLLLYQALAYFQLEKPANAKRSVIQANDISSESAYSKLASAYLSFSNKQIEDAIEKTDALLALQPDFAEANLLKGQLATLNKDYASAVDSFEKYHKLLPEVLHARIFLANAYIKNKQFDDAEKQLDLLLKISANQPFINQLKGLVRFQAKDYENAKRYTEVAIHNGLSNTPNRIIAGVSAFQQKNYEQAYQHLSAIQDSLSADHPMRRILVILQLKLGLNVEAGDNLLNMGNMTEADIVLLSSASAQLFKEGKTQQAKKLIEKTNALDFTDPVHIAQRGMMKMSLDELEGITDLKQALSLDPDLSSANAALAKAYLDGGQFEDALALANTWIEKEPSEVKGYVLAALANINMSKVTNAELMYEKILQIDPASPVANLYFCDKAVENGKPTEALKYLQKVLTVYPDYIPALSKYFVLQQRQDAVDAGIKPIKQAFESKKTDINYRLLLAQALLSANRFSETISILEQVTPEASTPDMYWVVLSNAYFSSSMSQKALATALRWTELQPNSAAAKSRYIILLEASGNLDLALSVAQDGKAKFSNEPKFSLFVIHFLILKNEYQLAQTEWSKLASEIQNNVVGKGLQAQIWLEQGQPEKALAGLKQYYEQRPSQRNTLMVAKALRDMNKEKEAVLFLQQHTEQHSDDKSTNVLIADLLMDSNPSEAIAAYTKIVKEQPRNVFALNNLAWLLYQQKNYTDAEKYARLALQEKPAMAEIKDTLALILLKKGDKQQALVLMEEVFAQLPNNADVSIHYAEALLANNQKKQALELLNNIKTNDVGLLEKISKLKK